MLNIPHHSLAFYSHGSSRIGGVCLWIKKTFLDLFNPIQRDSWIEVTPGRAAILRLDGPQGSLDIGIVYLHTGAAQAQRRTLQEAILRHLRPRETALSILFGDWNYVAQDEDRFCKYDARWTGDPDAPEQRWFSQTFCSERGFQELAQPDYTHDSALGQSRLDRVYSNHPLADQLDRDWGCSALDWSKGLSNHRPISFFRRGHTKRDFQSRPLPSSVFTHPEWGHRTALAYHQRMSQDSVEDGPLRRLVLLKEAMVQAAENLLCDQPTPRQASSFKDKLGITMQFIRATESVNLKVMASCAEDYPHIKTFVNARDPEARSSSGMHRLREHAVLLAHKSLADELRDYKAAQTTMDPHQANQVKERIHARLRRLAPGGSCSLRALRIQDPSDTGDGPPEGRVSTKASDIAAELVRHWGKVFGDAPIDMAALTRWLAQALHPPGSRPRADDSLWAIRKKDVSRAIRCSGNSLPGPDRIPYVAWRKLGPLATDVLFDAARAMARSDFQVRIREAYEAETDGDHPFNLALLVCLPKKPVGQDPLLGDIYDAAGTRPLAIVDTANRILANAYRYRWEPTLAAWISPSQRGFLPGRSILANVLDIEEAAAHYSVTEEDPAILLFDFAAAFPSVHQTFLLRALEHIGLPPGALSVIKALYDCCSCVLCFAGERWTGFRQKVGIRQGCPLSPLLFATVMDLFLRHLRRSDLKGTVRAYADDISVVVSSCTATLPALQRHFSTLARISNLSLNIPKTVCIPLWPAPLARARQVIQAACPPWQDIRVSDHGKYLGYFVGPGRSDLAWRAAGEKMLKRSAAWNWPSLGLFYSTTAYNTYVASLAGYVAQLDNYPPWFMDIEAAVLRRAAPGPYRWAMPEDLFRLRDHFGQVANFRDVRTTALAAKVRVTVFENMAHGGLDIRNRATALRAAINGTSRPERLCWASWLEQNPLFTLQEAREESIRLGLRPRSVMEQIAGSTPRPWPHATHNRIRRLFQSTLATKLREQSSYNPQERMRCKLRRWQLPGQPRVYTDRVLQRLTLIRSLVPPRVSAAVLGTLWNRWTTRRRFQQAGRCVLQCSDTAQDRIEHYAYCPVVQRAARTHLNLTCRPYPDGLTDFMMASGPPSHRHPSNLEVARRALLVYATYACTNSARHKAPADENEASQMMHQAILEGSRGHQQLQSILQDMWPRIPAAVPEAPQP